MVLTRELKTTSGGPLLHAGAPFVLCFSCRGVTLLQIARVLASITRLANTHHGYEEHFILAEYSGPGYPGIRVPVSLRWKSRAWQLIIPQITSPGYVVFHILQECIQHGIQHALSTQFL